MHLYNQQHGCNIHAAKRAGRPPASCLDAPAAPPKEKEKRKDNMNMNMSPPAADISAAPRPPAPLPAPRQPAVAFPLFLTPLHPFIRSYTLFYPLRWKIFLFFSLPPIS